MLDSEIGLFFSIWNNRVCICTIRVSFAYALHKKKKSIETCPDKCIMTIHVTRNFEITMSRRYLWRNRCQAKITEEYISWRVKISERKKLPTVKYHFQQNNSRRTHYVTYVCLIFVSKIISRWCVSDLNKCPFRVCFITENPITFHVTT